MGFARNSAIFLLISAVSVVSNTIAMALLSRSVGPEGRGVLAICLRAGSVWLAVAQVGIASTLLYHWRNRPSDRDRVLSNAALCVLVLGSLPLLLFLWPRVPTLLVGGEVPYPLLLLAFLPVPITAFNGILMASLKFAQQLRMLLAVHIVVEACRVGAAIALYVGGSFTVERFLQISFACIVISALLQGAVVYRRVGFSKGLSLRLILRLVRYGLVQNITVILLAFLHGLPIFVAVRVFSMHDTGLLATGMGIYGMGLMAAASFRSATQMKLALSSDRAAAPACLSYAVFSFFPFLAAALALVLIGRFLIVALYGAKFAAAYYPMLAILPAVMFHGILSPLAEYLVALGHFKTMALISGVSVVLGLAFTWAGAHFYGAVGCAIGFSAANLGRLVMILGAFMCHASVSPSELSRAVFGTIKRIRAEAMSRVGLVRT